jgi:CRP-like cAMP-binding protein
VSLNKLLAALPVEDYQRLAPSLRTVALPLRLVLQKQDEPIRDVCFPDGGVCSLVKKLEDGQVAEVAAIGAEGAIGASVFFGDPVAAYDVLVQVPGPSARVLSVDVFNREMERRGAFYNRVVRYHQALTNQVIQTTACNSLHTADQRCCRWLLMTRDKAGSNEWRVTHELLAMMLGVRRPTVTLIVNVLQRVGLIQLRKGWITIVDGPGLEARTCECYRTVRAISQRLLPELGAA